MLADAAAAALALPDLSGRCVDSFRARRAAIHAAAAGVASRRLGDSLGIGVRAVQTIRSQPHDVVLVRAVQKQVALRTAVNNLGRMGLDELRPSTQASDGGVLRTPTRGGRRDRARDAASASTGRRTPVEDREAHHGC